MVRLFAAACALVAAALVLWSDGGTSRAHIVAGQYSLEVQAPASANGQFTAGVAIHHFTTKYQAVQWKVNYDQSKLRAVSVSRDGPAPSQCEFTSIGADRVLLGCIDLGGANLSYSGNVFTITFECIGSGSASLSLSSADSFVAVDLNDKGAVHLHGATVQCGGGPPPPPPGDTCTVAQVITGDTFDCTDGRRIRMLQVDAQDLHECGGGWARAALANIFLPVGRTVALEYDVARTDSFGHTMAAPVWRGFDGADYNLSIVLVYVGLAKATNFGDGNVKFLDWANAAQVWAQAAQWNMWAPNKTYTGGCD